MSRSAWAFFLLAGVLIAGCDARTSPVPTTPAPSSSALPSEPPPSETGSRCIQVSAAKLDEILPIIAKPAGGTLRKGWAVRSDDLAQGWFIAAQINFVPGEGDEVVGVWFSDEIEPGVGFLSVDSFALRFTTWPDGTAPQLGLSFRDAAAQEAYNCARSR